MSVLPQLRLHRNPQNHGYDPLNLADILTFAELEVRVKTVDMLQKDGMIDRLEERLKRLTKEVEARGEGKIG